VDADDAEEDTTQLSNLNLTTLTHCIYSRIRMKKLHCSACKYDDISCDKLEGGVSLCEYADSVHDVSIDLFRMKPILTHPHPAQDGSIRPFAVAG